MSQVSNIEEEKEKENPINIIIPLSDLPLLKNDVVFPPFNHENLPLQKPTAAAAPFSPPVNHPAPHVALGWARQLRARLVSFLRGFRHFNGLNNIITVTNNNGSDDRKRWFGCVAAGTTVLLWWFYVRRRRRRRNDRMFLAIRENDEKIKQLLHQIAQMNQLLLSLHKSSLSQGGGVT